MRAAVVRSFDHPPRFETVATPQAGGERDVVVDVLVAGLHPRVRSGANGSHYTSRDELPLIPGIDGVGRTADGDLVYFVLPDTARGSMAEQTVVDPRRSVPLPADSDVAAIASAMNPAMSSWIALRSRIALQRIQIGSVAGPDIALPSAALRAANLRIMGSGQGSVATAEIVAQLPAHVAEITAGTLTVNAAPLPLSRVESAWNASSEPGQRVVFTPWP